jgi:hypothetical protein
VAENDASGFVLVEEVCVPAESVTPTVPATKSLVAEVKDVLSPKDMFKGALYMYEATVYCCEPSAS